MKLTNPWKKNSEELPPEEETYPPQSARRNFKPVVKYLGASIIGGVVGAASLVVAYLYMLSRGHR